MQLFYNPNIEASTSEFTFDKDESRHIIKVLRKKEGDVLHLTNGKGWLFEAEIVVADLKRCHVNIISATEHPKKAYTLHLAVAPTKMNDRYEWFLEKATEIGVDSITPIICDHSERKVVKAERFQKIIQSAMKQSQQYYLPVLNDALSFKAFIAKEHSGDLYIAHCEDTQRSSLKSQLQSSNSYTILIGPEGDFSSNEISTAIEHGYKPVMLGETRLRTETAAIVACHSVAFANE